MQNLQERMISVSTPLPRVTIYRPGGIVAFALVAIPVAAAIGAVGAYFIRAESLPLWVPGVPLVWVLPLALFWLALKTIRVDATGIEAGRPWQTWKRIPWESVRRVERRGQRVRVTGRDYTRISFNPGLLHNGRALRMSLLLQLPPDVLDDSLRDEARGVVIATSGKADGLQLPGIFRTRPHIALRLVAGLAALGGLGGAPLAIMFVPLRFETDAAIAAGCAVVGLLGILASLWLWQRVTLSDAGITVVGPLTGRARGMPWSRIVLLEYTPKGTAIRVTGRDLEGQVASPGPRVMHSVDATIYRAYFVRNLLDRHVMEAPRSWIVWGKPGRDPEAPGGRGLRARGPDAQ